MPAGPDITPPMKWRRIVNVSDNFIPNCDLKKNKHSKFRKNIGSTKLGDGGDLLGDGDALFEWESENATYY